MENICLHYVEFLQTFHDVEIISLHYVEILALNKVTFRCLKMVGGEEIISYTTLIVLPTSVMYVKKK